jgi:hypothetical protein
MVAEGVDHTRIAPAWAVWPVASFLLSNHFDEPSAPPNRTDTLAIFSLSTAP